MDIKSFLIGLLCSMLVVILFVAWSDVGAVPAAATETRYQFAAAGGETVEKYLFDQRTCTLYLLEDRRGWKKIMAGQPK